MQFPNMHGGSFPDIDTVDVNQWINEFDYSRYNYTQMDIQICAVPWDMGEAHIGARTISGIGNVVYFGTKAARDAWFEAIPDSKCFRFSTKYKELHRDQYIDVPLPFDIASTFNYIVVQYHLFANDGSPVLYESADGHRKWFWFIREVEFVAPNCTRLHILDDAFQTWIYDVEISNMILERGHAPLFETTAAAYLANPIGKAKNLLIDDVNFGDIDIARSQNALVFNAKNMHALIVTTADPQGTWGTKATSTWTVPGYLPNSSTKMTQGVPGYYAFSILASSLPSFLGNIASSCPQFAQTIKAIAFVSSDFLTLGTSFTFVSTACYPITASYKKTNLYSELKKSDFGFDSKYADIAKLYTYPYSYIVMTDENGNRTEVRIESTDGKIAVETTVNLVFPYLSIQGHLEGIGKTTKTDITFANVDTRTMPIQGNWYDYILEWNIPTFGVYQDAGTNNDYAAFYDRAQAVNDYTTSQTNEYANADTMVTNTSVQTVANSAVVARSNQAANQDYGAVNSLGVAYQRWDAGYANDTVNLQNDATMNTAAVGAAGGMISSIVGGALGTKGGNLTWGPAGALAGAITGAISGVTSMTQATIAVNLASAQAGLTNQYTLDKLGETNQNNADRTDVKNSADVDNTSTQNTATTAIVSNSAATQKANALRNSTNAQAAIDNQVAQASINAPMEFGAWANGNTASSRPMGLFANIVTQSDSAIAAAGDETLRYGYMYDRQWPFDGNWNIGKYFTYWKLKDFWVKNLNVPDMYMDKLRFFLYGGVTIWRKPEDIGNVTIYENMEA